MDPSRPHWSLVGAKLLNPGVRVLVPMRNPLFCAMSLMGKVGHRVNLAGHASFWRFYHDSWTSIQTSLVALALPYQVVQYEQMVLYPKETWRRVFSFCGIKTENTPEVFDGNRKYLEEPKKHLDRLLENCQKHGVLL